MIIGRCNTHGQGKSSSLVVDQNEHVNISFLAFLKRMYSSESEG